MHPFPRLRFGTLPLLLTVLCLLAALPATATRWVSLGPDDDGTVLSLAFAPSLPTTVYAGTWGGGISRSLDGGLTWASANAGLSNPVVQAMAVFPRDHRFVWAATEGGLYRSVDAGHNWLRVTTEPVTAVAADPDLASVVYIGTRNGMFRSGNGGATWIPMGETLVPAEIRFHVRALVVAPTRPKTLYAAYQGMRSGIFRSENGGIGWARIAWGEYTLLTVDPKIPANLWAVDRRGVHLTNDGGATWTRVLQRANISALALSADGARIFAAVPGQVLMSRDQGAHWRRIGTGLPNRVIHGMAVQPDNPARLLVGPESRGAFQVDATTGTWQWTSEGLVGFAATAVGPAPDGSGLWLASPLGLYVTADDGATWTRKLRGASLRSVDLAPLDANTLYTGGLDLRAGGPALFCSQDGGGSWMHAHGGLAGLQVLRVAAHPLDPLTAYAGTEAGLYKSIDAGMTWTELPLTGIVTDLVIDSNDPERLYATVQRRLYHSHDGGASWHVRMEGAVPSLGARLLRGVAVAATDPQSLAVIDGERIFLTRDRGTTWQKLEGPAFVRDHQTVLFAPGNEQILLVGGHGGAAFTTDGGATWNALGAGISGLDVNHLHYDLTRPGRLYAATWAKGVMVLDPAP